MPEGVAEAVRSQIFSLPLLGSILARSSQARI